MDIAKSLDKLSLKLDNLDNNNLLQLLISLENMIIKTRDILSKDSPLPPPPSLPLSSSTSSPTAFPPSPTFEDLFSYTSNPLNDSLVTRVHEHIKGLKYHPNSRSQNSPEIFLYGDDPYKYNKQSSEVLSIPIISSLPMAELLLAVNGTLKTEYNSMLINKYKDLHSYLDPHKDDEKSLDPSSPISALSLGATRRLQISLNGDKNTVKHTVKLESRSLNTMLPGFQDNYYHSIAPGRRSVKKERGIRYSITFRHVLPIAKKDKTSHLPTLIEGEDEAEGEKVEENEDVREKQTLDKDKSPSPDTLIFGSSLTKELDETLLSRYEKKFKVFSHSGAKIKDIEKDVKSVTEKGTLDASKVTSVFLLCGGNDIQNLRRDSDIENVYRDYETLVEVTKCVFPHANINIVSLIPRLARYRTHINNMHALNGWLENFSRNNSLRFISIFTHFLIRLPHIWYLNRKLFNGSNLHFNKVGNSVLAKVLMGVANSPR